MPVRPHASLLLLLTTLLLVIMGLALAIGGGWLLSLGGAWYYLAAGLLMLLGAALLARRRAHALWSFAALVGLTIAWSLWEAGLDWWPLAIRNNVPFLLGLLLLTPWIARRLEPPALRGGRIALGVALLAFVVVAVASWARDPHRIEGRLPPLQGNAAALDDPVPAGEWHAYGRTGHGQRYAPLDQITPQNVARLEVAWHFRTGDMRGQPGDPEETTFEVTPLKVGNRLFLCTPHQQVVALDATTGAEVWRFNPRIEGELALQHLTCRGLSYLPPGTAATPAATGRAPVGSGSQPVAAEDAPATDDCPAKLFMPTADGRLIALNPDDGQVCRSFGGGTGQIDLWANMPNKRAGGYYSTSPVVVTDRVVVVGGTVLDNVSTNEPSGVIRAFDVRTGALVWNWDPARPEATEPIAPDATYTPSSPNSWSISSVDTELGLVYVPLGNQPPDQWGGQRSEDVERYGSSVVALDLATGKVRWHFQTVHHDLWDYDVPSQPTLVDLTIDGERVPALVQPTKQGELFVLDRRDGRPLLPVEERPVPQGAVEDDRTAPTQPVSALSFEPEPLRERDMWGTTLFDQLYCRIAFRRLRYEGRYTPPSLEGTLVYPGNFGVFNWGGIAVDPVQQVAFTTPAYLAFTSQLVRRRDDTSLHVQGQQPVEPLPALNENFGAPYAVKMGAFTSPLGIPCQAPPWGHVALVDLRTGEVIWKHRNGTVRDSSPVPLPFRMGVPSLGGPLVTAGGVAFLSGTLDYYVRGYELATGRELWTQRLPAGGQATPMSYLGEDGRQYLLVVAGGHGSLGTQAGDHVIAYALPRSGQ
ncbi:membrane-bound PQQ-dependent dehydrogenase, glucose/quinate/shikimate family [Caldimonas thermodepolymerans]|uniref:Membrane-bound PQQ-dependent dehydrogenase, glucose/quinate/shikimate family n=1 Tax=Caldimonas thermodepolymerans TaxID=215580 RepID=A0A2S5T6R1_9BURK|nr:membrane-bound PQQ-dependent dehydrogenase, glucose/quinate/shikimate family [Caldimonas thermodepolymerans]PPE70670.1 membrane-bound PQQ-dependent dehydrogenase, glucose/quinate/shikimate family [Caldimonas thermodepolymerans]QPC33243.1 membrane-bound PQQ-dependent dehydrogenase, glucose/quinate/shikimate family [Caldimonas thermodepolymerans]RDH97566.1 quinoprotein glucose dehydrogenase [Caldimonas thermodepolymerans]